MQVSMEVLPFEGDNCPIIFSAISCNRSKMIDVQASEVDTKLTPLNVGP
jgi:hypothetical protein